METSKKEIIPITISDPKTGQMVVHDKDEGIRYPSPKEQMEKLKPLREGGRITAAIASQICDGASAVLICNEQGLAKLGLKPRAKIIGMHVVGSDPVEMLGGPIISTQKLLDKMGMKISDIDLYEVNEAFGCVPLAWLRAVKADINKLNVHGGAMALGHPLGATGTKLIATLLNALEQRHLKYGLLAICEGGGMSNATIIQRIDNSSKL